METLLLDFGIVQHQFGQMTFSRYLASFDLYFNRKQWHVYGRLGFVGVFALCKSATDERQWRFNGLWNANNMGGDFVPITALSWSNPLTGVQTSLFDAPSDCVDVTPKACQGGERAIIRLRRAVRSDVLSCSIDFVSTLSVYLFNLFRLCGRIIWRDFRIRLIRLFEKILQTSGKHCQKGGRLNRADGANVIYARR